MTRVSPRDYSAGRLPADRVSDYKTIAYTGRWAAAHSMNKCHHQRTRIFSARPRVNEQSIQLDDLAPSLREQPPRLGFEVLCDEFPVDELIAKHFQEVLATILVV